MKKLKKLFALVFVLCLLAGISATAFAADDTMYTVRVFSGQRGSINGSGDVRIYTVKAGTELNITNNIQNYVTITDTSRPYYATGIRESGKEETHALSFKVTKDEDFVVTYGVLGKQVAYYVRYINRNTGAEIAASEGPFYVNSGDRVYVAYIDINNYSIANARNLTKTMTGDYTFTFEYVPTPAGGNPAQGGAAQGGQAAGGQGAVAGQGGQAAGGQGAAAGGQPGAEGAAAPAAEPEEIIDLDVHLAAPEETGDVATPGSTVEPQPAKKSNGPVIAGVAAGVAAVGGLYWFLLVHRKKKKAEEQEKMDFDDDEFDDKK